MRTKGAAAEAAAKTPFKSDFAGAQQFAAAASADHIAYVMDMIEELKLLAEKNGLPVLSRVLGLALVEAQSELDRSAKK